MQARIFPFVLCLVALPLVACGEGTPDTPVENPREVVRAALLEDVSNCFADFEPYCIRDEEFVDAVIDDTLESYHRGVMPDRQRGVNRLVRQAGMRYRSALMATEESRATLLAKMRAYYENPTIEVEGDRATAIAYWVPTGFVPALRGSGYRLTTDSPLLEGSQPQTRYVAEQLLRVRQAHPSATRFQVSAKAYRGTSIISTTFSWDAANDIIWVLAPLRTYRTRAPLGNDLAALLSGQVNLTEGLYSCMGEGSAHDPLCN